MTRVFGWALLCVSLLSPWAVAGENSLRLDLPPAAYAVPGVEMNVYWDNIVLTQTPEQYKFTARCDVGRSEARRWTLTPKPTDVGEHRLTISVADAGGRCLGQASTVLRVVPAAAGQGRKLRLLVIGDSLTGATLYPNEIARLLSLPGNPTWEMLGTHRPKWAGPGVAHEGYGGWTWVRFNSYWNPDPKATPGRGSSPFVFPAADGKPALDMERYFKERCAGQRPDLVTIMLGINDCFGAKVGDPAAIDTHIDGMFKQADVLIAALRRAAPQADLGICLTTPPNARESGFEANYKGRYHRWGWKQIQHRLVERQMAKFSGREKEHLYVVPTELNLDPVDGYPVNNGVHPNAEGYKQIGASIYAWIKSRLQ
jgi:lysophospholipase L1-like esterase